MIVGPQLRATLAAKPISGRRAAHECLVPVISSCLLPETMPVNQLSLDFKPFSAIRTGA
jgi:hypothetical protein